MMCLDKKAGNSGESFSELHNSDFDNEPMYTLLNGKDAEENTSVSNRMDYDNHYEEVQEKFNCVIDQMKQVLQSQKLLNTSIGRLQESTVELGNSVRISAIYGGVKKLFILWKLVNSSNEKINEYYSELLYDAFRSFGIVAINPQPGELYIPEFHQKEDSCTVSNIIVSCNKCNWGWKLDEVVLKKAIVKTVNDEETSVEPKR